MNAISRLREWGTVALVFLIPWQARWIAREGLRPLTGAPLETLTLSTFATGALVAALLVLTLADREARTRIVARSDRRVLAAVLALVSLAALSASWSHEPDLAIQKAATLALAASAAFAFLAAREPRRLAYAFVASAAVQAAIGLAQVIDNFSPASTPLGMAEHSAFAGGAYVVEWAGGRLLRAYGTLPHPNVLGGMLALAALVAVAEYARTRSSRYRITLVAALSAILLGLFLTFSRSAWLACAVGLVPLTIVAVRSKERARLWLAAAAVPAIVAAVVLLPAVLGRASGQGRLETRSTAERVASWRDGLALFAAHPFGGVGAGQIDPAAYSLPTVPTEPAHLVPLQVAVELGLPGLALVLAIWWFASLNARKDPLALGLFLALSTIALFDHYLWTLWAGNLLLAFGTAYILRGQES